MAGSSLKSSRVFVDDSDYRASHQQAPRGTGLWIYCAVDPRRHRDYLEHVLIADFGTFGQTKARARVLAARRGLSIIFVCA